MRYFVPLSFHMLELICQYMNVLIVKILSHKSLVISNQLLCGNTDLGHTDRLSFVKNEAFQQKFLISDSDTDSE